MNTEVAQGVESIEFGIPGVNYALPGSWVKFNNIADGSVSYTSNKDNATPIIPEDKDIALLTLYTPGNSDSFNFDLLEISEANLKALFNTTVDPATSSTTIMASRARPNLAIRLTTRPQFGLKKVYIFPNTICSISYKNNFTKNALVALSVQADIYSYPNSVDTTLPDMLYIVQTVKDDGTIIDQTLPVVNAGTDVSVSTGVTTATLTGTATPHGSNTIASSKWTKKSGAGGVSITSPNSLSTGLTGLAAGVYVFTLTATDSVGSTASDDVTVTVAA